MQGLDYYMDGLLHEYLNQPEEGDEEMPVFITDYYEEKMDDA